jgi:hypothetical protein
MLRQSVSQHLKNQSRLASIPQKKEKRNRIIAREDAKTIREALTLPASVYLSQFEFAEVSR